MEPLAAEIEAWLAALAPLWAASDTLHGCRLQATTSAADLLAEARDALACPTFEREFAAAMPGLVADLGPVDVLVNNAGMVQTGIDAPDRLFT